MTDYWPWWLGALALGLITVGYALWTRRSLGVSGAWSRVLIWREAREVERLDAQVDVIDLREALAAATAEQFGAGRATAWPQAPERPSVADPFGPPPAAAPARHEARHAEVAPRRPQSPVFSLVLLASVFLGGLIAALLSGRFQIRTDMGEGYSRLVTDSPVWMTVVLFVGGVLVGFGTRMAGGCTSGHGLTGCSRLQPVSLVATASFFASAVAVSFLVWKVV